MERPRRERTLRGLAEVGREDLEPTVARGEHHVDVERLREVLEHDHREVRIGGLEPSEPRARGDPRGPTRWWWWWRHPGPPGEAGGVPVTGRPGHRAHERDDPEHDDEENEAADGHASTAARAPGAARPAAAEAGATRASRASTRALRASSEALATARAREGRRGRDQHEREHHERHDSTKVFAHHDTSSGSSFTSSASRGRAFAKPSPSFSSAAVNAPTSPATNAASHDARAESR
jgi:hypothetical protein